MGKSSIGYDLSLIDLSESKTNIIEKREIVDELTLSISLKDLYASPTLNIEQLFAYSTILDQINSEQCMLLCAPGAPARLAGCDSNETRPCRDTKLRVATPKRLNHVKTLKSVCHAPDPGPTRLANSNRF